jgi:hypothetical protein
VSNTGSKKVKHGRKVSGKKISSKEPGNKKAELWGGIIEYDDSCPRARSDPRRLQRTSPGLCAKRFPFEYWRKTMTELCALVEGPKWADTKFYGNWLLAAAKANELWTEALENPRFSKRLIG